MYEIAMNILMACHYNKRIEPEPVTYYVSYGQIEFPRQNKPARWNLSNERKNSKF